MVTQWRMDRRKLMSPFVSIAAIVVGSARHKEREIFRVWKCKIKSFQLERWKVNSSLSSWNIYVDQAFTHFLATQHFCCYLQTLWSSLDRELGVFKSPSLLSIFPPIPPYLYPSLRTLPLSSCCYLFWYNLQLCLLKQNLSRRSISSSLSSTSTTSKWVQKWHKESLIAGVRLLSTHL
jgi:hypothetical protein